MAFLLVIISMAAVLEGGVLPPQVDEYQVVGQAVAMTSQPGQYDDGDATSKPHDVTPPTWDHFGL